MYNLADATNTILSRNNKIKQSVYYPLTKNYKKKIFSS